MRQTGMTERAAPFHCPYCGDEDLRPFGETHGQWRCGACQRVFALNTWASPLTGPTDAPRSESSDVTASALDDPTQPARTWPSATARRSRSRAGAIEILRWAPDQFGTDWCVTSSMADAVLPHLASQVAPGIDVVFLDTGYHFAETIGTRDAVAATLPVTVKTILPLAPSPSRTRGSGRGCTSATRTPAARCARSSRSNGRWRPTAPGPPACAGRTRRPAPGAQVVEWDAKREMVKVNPIAAWTDEQVDAYVADNGILVNPLLSDGYGSIGCAPVHPAAAAGRGRPRRPLGRAPARPSAACTSEPGGHLSARSADGGLDGTAAGRVVGASARPGRGIGEHRTGHQRQ